MKRGTVLLALAWCALGPVEAAGAQEPDVSFVVLGHIRTSSDETLHPLLDELVDEIERLEPDLVFLAGDAIWGGLGWFSPDPERIEQSWEALDGALGRLGVPIHRVPGNHDINDAVTRDVFFRRYGPLPRAVDFGGCRFLLLSSFRIPSGEWPARTPRRWSIGLDEEQMDFIRAQIADGEGIEHVFLLLHHLLWWEPDAPWWTGVHPQLVGSKVSAVIGGDSRFLKYTYQRRDGIHYVHASMSHHAEAERQVPRLRRGSEPARLQAFQLDPFLHVTVRGEEVSVDVVTVGEMTTGRVSPQRWADVYGASPDADVGRGKVFGKVGRLLVVAGVLAAAFVGGAIFGRRSRRFRL